MLCEDCRGLSFALNLFLIWISVNDAQAFRIEMQ